LANVALTALDEYCQKEFGTVTPRPKKYGGGKYIQNPIIRYADDFVVVCKSESEAKDIKERITTDISRLNEKPINTNNNKV